MLLQIATETTDKSFIKELAELFVQLWQMELYHSGDNAVRLNQIIIAISVVLIGVVLSRYIAGSLAKKLLRWGKLSANAAHLIRRIIHLTLIVLIVLMALPIAGIPITIFTVLGGGIAIGIGFGAQTLFNNLISGMMIMAERPIRIGDVVDITGFRGTVQDISNRCVRLKQSDGIDVLIPNSAFLENPLLNWTLCDKDIRCQVSVGVAYGTSSQKVKQILLDVASNHPKVYKEPEPVVLFQNFGDNSLEFSVLFWAEISSPREKAILESDIRFMIDEDFAKANVVISFPQRDVHLDTLKPLEIRITKDS